MGQLACRAQEFVSVVYELFCITLTCSALGCLYRLAVLAYAQLKQGAGRFLVDGRVWPELYLLGNFPQLPQWLLPNMHVFFLKELFSFFSLCFNLVLLVSYLKESGLEVSSSS